MTFEVLSEADVLARYKRAAGKEKRRTITVLADLTATSRSEMVDWLRAKGVLSEEDVKTKFARRKP